MEIIDARDKRKFAIISSFREKGYKGVRYERKEKALREAKEHESAERDVIVYKLSNSPHDMLDFKYYVFYR